jgi:WD40 repeat protein
MESLSVVRSIFCALPPVHLTVIRNSLAVAFRDDSTLTHSLMVYNLDNNGDETSYYIFFLCFLFLERFDHLPENDHCDKISSISGCSKLKLIATGSLDGTIRIWNGKNQLIRFR